MFVIALFIFRQIGGLKWAFFAIIIFLGLRYKWGNDYVSYLQGFVSFQNQNASIFDFEKYRTLTDHYELGWVILNRLFDKLGLGFFGMVMVLSLFENWAIYRMLSKYVDPKNYWVSIIVFLFSWQFCMNASMMRQYLCICIYLIVVDLMTEKKIKGYLWISIGLIILGASFHKSNIAMLFTLPFYYIHFKPTKRTYVWMTLIGIIFVIWQSFGRSLIEHNLLFLLEGSDDFYSYMTYWGVETGGSDTGLGTIFRYVMMAVWLWLLPKFERNKQTIILLGILSYFLEVIGEIIPTAGRFHIYFGIMDMLRWAWLIQIAYNNT